jgi:hypothetical protein
VLIAKAMLDCNAVVDLVVVFFGVLALRNACCGQGLMNLGFFKFRCCSYKLGLLEPREIRHTCAMMCA